MRATRTVRNDVHTPESASVPPVVTGSAIIGVHATDVKKNASGRTNCHSGFRPKPPQHGKNITGNQMESHESANMPPVSPVFGEHVAKRERDDSNLQMPPTRSKMY